MFTAKDVKELRERTGCGMMDCKAVLVEADGDMDKAIELLREKGLAKAAKKAGRIAAEGLVEAYVTEDNKVGAIIEVNSETDFVAKNAEFKAFVSTLAKIVAEENPADVDALKALKYTDTELTVDDMLKEKILTIGENMNIRRFTRYEGQVVSYIHGEGRIGVMVNVEGDLSKGAEAAKDAAMQIAAINPLFLTKEVVPAETIANEKNIIMAQIKEDPKNANKPENIIEKMVDGKINKYFQENCLLQQAFVKDDKVTVAKYLESNGVMVTDYVRFEKGEGIEKKEDNFAEEVASMMK